MRRLFLLLVGFTVAISFFGASAPSLAQGAPDDRVKGQSTSGPPKIGLVLGGGGARGFAHIGVIETLEEAGIRPDFIAGTSMGAVVGALYAAGYSPQELRQIATDIDWNELFDDSTSRERLIFRRKTDDQLFSTRIKLGVKDGRAVLPKGIIQGQKLRLTLNELINRRAPGTPIERLKTPFRAVATDLETRETVVFDHGDVARAVFASMAVPGLLPPVDVEGRTLVDGGIANNLPVSVVREMGAGIVIVVDLGTTPAKAEDIKNFTDVIVQLTAFMTLETANREISSLTERDILIQPALQDISPLAFSQGKELIRLGRDAAAMQREKIGALARNRPNGLNADQIDIAPSPPLISFVRLENRTVSPDRLIRDALDVETGVPLDFEKLADNITDLYGYDLFRRIDYRILDEPESDGILITAEPPDIGNNFLRFNIDYETDFSTLGIFNATASYTRRNINAWGGEWRTTVTVGDEPSVSTEIYQPLDALQRWFIAVDATGSRQRTVAFDENAFALGALKVDSAIARFSAGRTFGRSAELRAGLAGGVARVSPGIGLPGIESESGSGANLFGSLIIDTLDDFTFPKSGYTLALSGVADLAGGDELLGNRAIDFSFVGARTFGDLTIVPILSGAFAVEPSNGDLGGAFAGGFLSLSGLPRNSRQGRHAVIGTVAAYHRLSGGDGFVSTPIYVGGSLEAGNVYDRIDEITLNSLTYSGSLFLALDTPLGALIFGTGLTDENQRSAFMFFGQPF